jgi:hypothetical protein
VTQTKAAVTKRGLSARPLTPPALGGYPQTPSPLRGDPLNAPRLLSHRPPPERFPGRSGRFPSCSERFPPPWKKQPPATHLARRASKTSRTCASMSKQSSVGSVRSVVDSSAGGGRFPGCPGRFPRRPERFPRSPGNAPRYSGNAPRTSGNAPHPPNRERCPRPPPAVDSPGKPENDDRRDSAYIIPSTRQTGVSPYDRGSRAAHGLRPWSPFPCARLAPRDAGRTPCRPRHGHTGYATRPPYARLPDRRVRRRLNKTSFCPAARRHKPAWYPRPCLRLLDHRTLAVCPQSPVPPLSSA